ncbi:MAG: hypothetical protein HY966_00810 [Ignavibacteriales bacterium]|nr:hypothetical protein [Ignavibacteriales bacterium]
MLVPTGQAWIPTSAGLIPQSAFARELSDEVRRQLKFFSPDEYLILQSAAERIVGPASAGAPSAAEIDVALRADAFLAGADPEIQEQFHLLLTVFNHPVFTFLFDFRFSAFVNMNDDEKDSYIEDWMTSPIAFRRTAFVGLKRLCMSMYYTDARSWPAIGYDGVFAQ